MVTLHNAKGQHVCLRGCYMNWGCKVLVCTKLASFPLQFSWFQWLESANHLTTNHSDSIIENVFCVYALDLQSVGEGNYSGMFHLCCVPHKSHSGTQRTIIWIFIGQALLQLHPMVWAVLPQLLWLHLLKRIRTEEKKLVARLPLHCCQAKRLRIMTVKTPLLLAVLDYTADMQQPQLTLSLMTASTRLPN